MGREERLDVGRGQSSLGWALLLFFLELGLSSYTARMHRQRFLLPSLAFILVVTGRLAFAGTDAANQVAEPAATKPAGEPEPAKPTEAAQPTPHAPKAVQVDAAKPTPKLACPSCAGSLPPVYVADWARLAALTQSDSQIFTEVDGFAQRHDVVRNITVAGVVLGGIATMVGGFHAVSADEWTKFDKWSVAGGLSLTAVSLFIAWAMEPDRDDFYTLINQWNLRHPQQVLAP